MTTRERFDAPRIRRRATELYDADSPFRHQRVVQDKTRYKRKDKHPVRYDPKDSDKLSCVCACWLLNSLGAKRAQCNDDPR